MKNIFVKPNVNAECCVLFLVKANVHASMKNKQYSVYVHLDQLSGEVKDAKCNCENQNLPTPSLSVLLCLW